MAIRELMIHNPGSVTGLPNGSSPRQPQRKKLMEQAEELKNRRSSMHPSEQAFSLPVRGLRGENTGERCIRIYNNTAMIHSSTGEGVLRILFTAYRLHARNRRIV